MTSLTSSAWCRKEAAHVLLHETPPGSLISRNRKEVEAESVAFVVAAAHGMATDGYSFPYVAGWAGADPAKAVAQTQARVAQAARVILDVSPAVVVSGGRVPGAEVAVETARQRCQAERQAAGDRRTVDVDPFGPPAKTAGRTPGIGVAS